MAVLFPRTIEAIRALGRTHAERAAALGVSVESIQAYVTRGVLPRAAIIARHPLVLSVFCDEARARFDNNAPGDTSEAKGER